MALRHRARKRRMQESNHMVARATRDSRMVVLAAIVLLQFVVIMLSGLAGVFYVIKAGVSPDPSAVALGGAVLGYAAANAQTVVGFYFGSSFGSTQNADRLVDLANTKKG